MMLKVTQSENPTPEVKWNAPCWHANHSQQSRVRRWLADDPGGNHTESGRVILTDGRPFNLPNKTCFCVTISHLKVLSGDGNVLQRGVGGAVRICFRFSTAIRGLPAAA